MVTVRKERKEFLKRNSKLFVFVYFHYKPIWLLLLLPISSISNISNHRWTWEKAPEQKTHTKLSVSITPPRWVIISEWCMLRRIGSCHLPCVHRILWTQPKTLDAYTSIESKTLTFPSRRRRVACDAFWKWNSLRSAAARNVCLQWRVYDFA